MSGVSVRRSIMGAGFPVRATLILILRKRRWMRLWSLSDADSRIGALGQHVGPEAERLSRPARGAALTAGALDDAALGHEPAEVGAVQFHAGQRFDRGLQFRERERL